MLMAKDVFTRVDDDLFARLEAQAKLENRSISALVRHALITYMGTLSEPAKASDIPAEPPTEKKRGRPAGRKSA